MYWTNKGGKLIFEDDIAGVSSLVMNDKEDTLQIGLDNGWIVM